MHVDVGAAKQRMLLLNTVSEACASIAPLDFVRVRMASHALDTVRKEEGKRLSASKKRKLMRGRHIFLNDLQ